MTKIKNKLPYPIYLGLFLLVLGTVVSLLLATVNEITYPRIIENEKRNSYALIEKLNLNNVEDITDSVILRNNVNKVFKGSFNNLEAYCFDVNVKNKFTNISLLIVINENHEICNVVSKTILTTNGYDNEFAKGFGVVGLDDSDYEDSFEIVTGATFSSNSIKEAIQIAYDMFHEILIGGLCNEKSK